MNTGKPTSGAGISAFVASEMFDEDLLVGRSQAMAGVRDVATDVARRRSTVMILGETGSGKEMVARHIPSSGRPYVNIWVTNGTKYAVIAPVVGALVGGG